MGNPLAAFYFNRGIYQWGTHIESSMNEAEARVRRAFKNRKGAEVFIQSERTKIYNHLLGIESIKGIYRDVSMPTTGSNMFKG